jgi:dihydroorotase
MRRALEWSARAGFAVIDHCEDPTLKGAGVAHEGRISALLGLAGIPSAAEDVMVARDLVLAAATAGHVHIAHLSTRGAMSLVREAKARGVRVTCEVTPHHLLLTDDRLRFPVSADPDAKMNPPLREAADRDALVAGVADGTVDAIATDHAPHHPDEKREGFVSAPFGIVGLETAVSLMLDRLVHRGIVPLARLIALFTTGPAGILRIPAGTLAPGSPADLTALAPDLPVVVKSAAFRSKARNTPFEGWSLRGGVAATIVGGRTVYVNPVAPGAEAFVSP